VGRISGLKRRFLSTNGVLWVKRDRKPRVLKIDIVLVGEEAFGKWSAILDLMSVTAL